LPGFTASEPSALSKAANISSLFPSHIRATCALNRLPGVVTCSACASPCQCAVSETGGRGRKKSVGHPADRDRSDQVIVIDGDFDDVW
jgi:hypothetical protein